MDQISRSALEWSLTHIARFGDTDLFPVPFEYKAVKHNWDKLRSVLEDIDISEYECRPFQRFLIPKPQGGYRVAIQLDPIDCILYTALAYEASAQIENQRISQSQRVACSYRIQTDAKGQFFKPMNGWDDFSEKSLELAESDKYSYVVIADIADFYNQISHHRVRNALESAGIQSERAANFENFLMNLTRGHSRGIPVGPSASIILAEATLNDVDLFLLREGYVHTRYVDDFRIFCTNRSQALKALHDLSEYLYTSHRLSLQSKKTKPIPIGEFIEEGLLHPERIESSKKTEKINEILHMIAQDVGYNFTEEDLTSEYQRRIVMENLEELFDACLKGNPLQLGLARYLVRRATQLRTDVLQEAVLQNLEVLVPIARDISVYLLKTVQAKSHQKIGNGLLNYITDSHFAFLPYLRLWITHTLTEKFSEEFEQPLAKIIRESNPQLGSRPFALLANKLRYIDWVRNQKETWQNNGPWDKRAVIWAGAALPNDERRNWLKRVQNAGDDLDRAIALLVAEQG